MTHTMLPQIEARLLAIANELDSLSEQIKWYIPQNADVRTNLFYEAWTRTGPLGNALRRAVTNLREGRQGR